MKGAKILSEISASPSTYSRLIAAQSTFTAAVDLIKSREIQDVMIVARGTSGNAGYFLKHLIETELGLPVGIAAPAAVSVVGSSFVRSIKGAAQPRHPSIDGFNSIDPIFLTNQSIDRSGASSARVHAARRRFPSSRDENGFAFKLKEPFCLRVCASTLLGQPNFSTPARKNPCGPCGALFGTLLHALFVSVAGPAGLVGGGQSFDRGLHFGPSTPPPTTQSAASPLGVRCAKSAWGHHGGRRRLLD